MTEIKVTKQRQDDVGRKPKLNDIQINSMVKAYNAGTTQAELARQFNVSVSTVRKYLRLRREK